MIGSLASRVAGSLSPTAKRRVRRATDGVLSPVGSLRGVRTDARVVALTYDDGPDPDGTPAVLDALAELGLSATFFVLVERAEAHPELLRRVLDEGHEVALHGIDHSRLTERSAGEVHRLLVEGKRRLEAVAGRRVRLFRPAYGSQSLGTFLAARRAGLDPVVWGPTVADWVDGAAEEVAARALPAVHPGAVVLLHDGFEVPEGDLTPRPTFDRGDVTRSLVGALRAVGYEGMSVSGLSGFGRAWRTAWFRP
ncbi:polysaccharide deacetylase family protein [Umezawaea tangerina]|uniref:Peptidoglycan/xylan/chitin deacetylase (PgdA/CDA1 family) n=1 Tax=Umezawaea tangerina TaxID=84725 RepID=A0A2T0T4V4_9PSEU|nr:polysaccharide deacetylase family protein [Umezawaea tangerina]PRY40715.1 peptidoglycan/xylan/chitin deacetylase (PgdA/CDA1 family) [Umezawaea tangerina]